MKNQYFYLFLSVLFLVCIGIATYLYVENQQYYHERRGNELFVIRTMTGGMQHGNIH